MELVFQLDLIGPDTLPLLLLTAGLLLSLAEALAPGANFIVLGIALIGAGLVGLALGPILGPLATVIVLALATLFFGAVSFYGYRELDLYGGKGQQQTRDSDTLKGKTGRVTELVTPTGGEVKLDEGGFNPYYSARSLDRDIEEGTEVIVIDPGGGNVVTVESLGVVEDEIDRKLAAGRDVDPETREREAERARRERETDVGDSRSDRT